MTEGVANPPHALDVLGEPRARADGVEVLARRRKELALKVQDDPDLRPPGAFSMRGHSVGGFGSVTTNKVIATIAMSWFTPLHCGRTSSMRFGRTIRVPSWTAGTPIEWRRLTAIPPEST